MAWGLETGAETLCCTAPAADAASDGAAAEAVCRQCAARSWSCTATGDRIVPYETGVALARWTGGRAGDDPGRGPRADDARPVLVNRLIRDFAESLGPQRATRASAPGRRARDRRRRALYVCSPIGLGHVRRDLAIADELRAWHPDLQIDWLAQDPVTAGAGGARRAGAPGARVAGQRERAHRVRGGRARPARVPGAAADGRDPGRQLHGLRTTWSRDEPYDLWIADEGWDIDYFLHENPELKRTAYAWLTDFVGWLPMPDGGAAEARADRRLQRGDDRADRAATRACATGRCSSATRTTWSTGPRSAPGCRRSGTGRRSTTSSPGTSPAVDARRSTGKAARRARLPARRAGLRRHGRRLGRRRRTCCAGPRRRSRAAAQQSPGCGWSSVTGPRIDPASLPRRTAWRSAATCPICTGTWPPATWRWSRAV